MPGKSSSSAMTKRTRCLRATTASRSWCRNRSDSSVLPASCRQNETMRDRKACRRDAGDTLEPRPNHRSTQTGRNACRYGKITRVDPDYTYETHQLDLPVVSRPCGRYFLSRRGKAGRHCKRIQAIVRAEVRRSVFSQGFGLHGCEGLEKI